MQNSWFLFLYHCNAVTVKDITGYILTTEPSTDVLQFERKSTSRLSCLIRPPTAIVLTSKIAESSTFFSLKFSTSISEEVIIFKLSSNRHTALTALRPASQCAALGQSRVRYAHWSCFKNWRAVNKQWRICIFSGL